MTTSIHSFYNVRTIGLNWSSNNIINLVHKSGDRMDPLRELKIFGLRGFATTQSLRFAEPNGSYGSGLTYLTGPNNSGKSTIIEAFRAYLWRHNRPSFHEEMRNRSTNFVRIEFHYRDRLDWIESLRPGGSETKGNISPGSGAPYVVPSRRYFAPYFHRQPQIYDRQSFLMTSGDSSFQQPRGPTLNQFEMRLFAIDQDETKRAAFNNIIEKIIPRGVNWTIDQSANSQWVLRFLGKDKAHSAEGVGEGIASLFTLVAAFYDSIPGDIIVIDEPELSLHPAYQRRLAQVISEFSAERQIIISTHSPYMIDVQSIRNGAELCRTWERAIGTEICQMTDDAKMSWKSLTSNDFHNPHRLGLEAKEVFFLEDGVIVVEGQEDIILFPKLLLQTQISVEASFFGWGAGGASNIRHVLEILRSLGFAKVAAVFDGDKLEEMADVRKKFPIYYVSAIPFDDIRDKPGRTIKAKAGMLSSDGTLPLENEDAARRFVGDVASYFAIT